MRSAIVAAAAALGFSACQPCAVRPPEVVHIPITECPAPPHELLMPISIGDLPVFVPPTDAQAVSALTPAGEDRLREIVTTIAERERQCRAWLEISTVREKP